MAQKQIKMKTTMMNTTKRLMRKTEKMIKMIRVKVSFKLGKSTKRHNKTTSKTIGGKAITRVCMGISH